MATVTTGAHAQYDHKTRYISNINDIRRQEYPSLTTLTYLDHAGSALYPTSLIEAYTAELTQNLFGNPHSASTSSQLSTRKIEDTRLEVLQFFDADPDYYDVVFTANATAAIKLVGDIFRDQPDGFRYIYHRESHTSMVGLRELANLNACFADADEADRLIREHSGVTTQPLLVGCSGQSNMTGYKFATSWMSVVGQTRKATGALVYSLLDAAALASTSPLDLSNMPTKPDFVVVSFYKIFGFPDLGALIVAKTCKDLVARRRYFGGGTVDSVVACSNPWHAKKQQSLHSQLEDGTPPFHAITALGLAMKVNKQVYGPIKSVQRHVRHVTETCLSKMVAMRHWNGRPVCVIYGRDKDDVSQFGPCIAFNIQDALGRYISTSEVEKLAIVKNIHLRVGGLCNPGGIAFHLGLSAADIKQHHSNGYRCGEDSTVTSNQPMSVVRVSFGAPSSLDDVQSLLDFMTEFFIESQVPSQAALPDLSVTGFFIESLSVFPIKSCAAFKIPPDILWEVGSRGLKWDREWCLVHEGTRSALNQKRHPLMALVRPTIDLANAVLRVEHNITGSIVKEIVVSLNDQAETKKDRTVARSSNICGEIVDVEHYTSPLVSHFFTEALGVPCTLARISREVDRQVKVRRPQLKGDNEANALGRSIALSNESPILLISRSSVNKLNEDIKAQRGPGRAVSADSFRGNITIAQQLDGSQSELAYVEDDWSGLRFGDNPANRFEVLGPCQRCQMVCVDQKSASRGQEPFSTLSKTRRRNGRVWFGMHICLDQKPELQHVHTRIKVGDRVSPISMGRSESESSYE